MFYTIYQTTNKINGKIYVGKHKTSNLEDGYIGSGLLLWRAIDKYGIENFEKKILFFCESEDAMDAKEAEIVDEDFVARADTYNIALGGSGGWYHCNGELTHNNKHNHRRVGFLQYMDKGINPWKEWWNNASDEEIKEWCLKVSKGVKKHIDEFGSWWTGKHHKESTKEKMRIYKATFHPQAGSKNSQYGKHWWKDPNDKTKSLSIKEGDPVPEGWIRGRWQIQTALKGNKIHKCRFCGAIKEKDQSNKTISTCKNKTLCWHFQPTKKLAKYFGFDKSSIGTERYYEEYHNAAKRFFAMWNSYGLSEVVKRINWENKSSAGLYSLYAALSKLFPEYKLLTID